MYTLPNYTTLIVIGCWRGNKQYLKSDKINSGKCFKKCFKICLIYADQEQ